MKAACRLGQKEITLKYLCNLVSVTTQSGFQKITEFGHNNGFDYQVDKKEIKESEMNEFIKYASEHFKLEKLTTNALKELKIKYNEEFGKSITYDNNKIKEIKEAITNNNN
jgi:hypothetical protein